MIVKRYFHYPLAALGILLMVAVMAKPAASIGINTIYVDADATGDNNGSTWANAYTQLQLALDSATANSEIWVAAGVYTPTRVITIDVPRSAAFQMKNNVAIFGGFDPSAGVTAFEDRDWVTYETILSGDIGVKGDMTDNVYHVFYHPNTLALNSTAILDGFTITGAYAESGSWQTIHGGGMYNEGASPTVRNCTFSHNTTAYGGGMANYELSSPTLVNTTFYSNTAEYGGGMWIQHGSPMLTGCTFEDNASVYGAGIFSYLVSSPTLTNCTFKSNEADWDGGGIYFDSGTPVLNGCAFIENTSGEEGAGMYNYVTSPQLTNCTFSGNHASTTGGGMHNYSSTPKLINTIFSANIADIFGGAIYNFNSSPAITNCTFYGNWAKQPNGGGSIYGSTNATPTLINSILWGGIPDEIANWSPEYKPTITYSDVAGSFSGGVYPGTGNINTNPLFVDPAQGDFHIFSFSQCVDKGSNSAPDLPTQDFEGHTRIVDGDGNGSAIVDMGVFEGMFTWLFLPIIQK